MTAMIKRPRVHIAVLAAMVMCHPAGAATHAHAGSTIAQSVSKGALVPAHATGSFDVRITPRPPDDNAAPPSFGRMSIDKHFHGDLDGTSQGTMLTGATDATGARVYVAIERVTGTLRGRTGTFLLMHGGTMTRTAQHLSVTVVPESGTGDLAGLTGKMAITIVDGKHLYDFEYTVGEKP
jgi:uncharacterized protein DUF3224